MSSYKSHAQFWADFDVWFAAAKKAIATGTYTVPDWSEAPDR